MSKSKHSRSPRSARRRPFGVSRRKQHQLGFETLEDRRVMSADSSAVMGPYLSSGSNFTGYSSLTEEGLQYLLQQELNQYAAFSGDASLAETYALPLDEYFEHQWHLLNVGQEVGLSTANIQDIFGVAGEDINVLPVWEAGYTGAGVVVAVLDSGVQTDHPDLDDNIDELFQFDALTLDSNANPDLVDVFPINAHGTIVAGLIGAEANDIGGVGVAPGVQLVPIRLIDTPQTVQAFVEAFRFGNGEIDITNNSWGPAAPRGLGGPTFLEHLALRDSAVFGRDGLGTIHVFAAGNDAGTDGLNDSAGYNGWINSRYTIGVTGVDHDGHYNNIDGTVTDYAETSASVLVAAPTGSVFQQIGSDFGNGSGLLSTDTTNDTGLNQDPLENGQDLDFDSLEDEAYTSRFNGTSGAAPLVSGVIALMLEANPNLSARDVQEILVRSSRQNAEFDRQANGFDKASGVDYQSTWFANQVPLFHDPDVYDPLIPNAIQFYTPILDPLENYLTNIPGINTHYAPTPQVLTNGAGYTVSQGRGTNGDQIGYAHGVIDAELAVSLAEQWTDKGETLPAELSFTTTSDSPIPAWGASNLIPAAFVVDPGGDSLIIPGGLGANGDWQGYYSEYYADAPDFTPFGDVVRGAPLELTVPEINGQDIIVEHVEVVLNIGGANATSEVMDNLRIVLVSPNGTHSELNHYHVDPSFTADQLHQTSGVVTTNPDTGEAIFALQPNGFNGVGDEVDRLDPTPVTGGNFTFSLSTNRSWGERTGDAIVFDPTTNEPFNTLAGLGGNMFGGNGPLGDPTDIGEVVTQGWQLHFENYGTTDLTLNEVEIIWHGTPVSANSQRLQGLIGVDDNRDDLFNYSRVNQNVDNFFGDPNELRLGEVQNYIDVTHESMAADITVLAFRDVNGNGVIDDTDLLVDQFVTGADGNYYFDLVPDDYIIALDDDTLGDLTPLDDSLSPAGMLKDYQSQWAISSEYFQVWDYDSNLDVLIDPVTGAPDPFLDGNNNPIEYGVNHINFLLDPGAPLPPEVAFNGQVIADLNGDGVFNGVDTVAPGILVFGDTNRNNEFDAGEFFTSTDANGNYSLVVPSDTIANINVGVIPPVEWQTTNPESGILAFFTEPGDIFNGVDFALQPPADGGGVVGSAQPGTILGFVFGDDNQDGVRQASELGISNIQVYIDNNDTGANDAGDTVATTNAAGAFIFTSVPVGTHKLRVDLSGNPTLQQTVPVFGLPNTITITGARTVSGVRFGVNNTANLDFGDLPEVYSTRFNGLIHNDLTGGARHRKGIFFLGSGVDAELDGTPSADALGDNLLGNDEDGIFVDPLIPGVQGNLEAIASRHGGYLQAWIDFNGDGDFDDIIGGVSERIFTNELLDPGSNNLSFAVPDVIDADVVYARFRYGEFGLGQRGLAIHGEVEDYVLQKAPPPPAVHGPDFNEDGDVDGSDFLALQRGMGILTNALPGNGDANSDGAVGMDDFMMWMHDYKGGTVALAAVQSSDDESEEQVSAALAAALSPLPVSDGSDLYSYSSDGSYQSVSILGPPLYQPGFPEELPEDLPATVIDTAELTRSQLAPIAGRVAVRNAYADLSSETVTEEQASYDAAAAVQTVEARDAVFASRLDRIEDADSAEGSSTDEAEALAVALDSETDWLFG